MGLCRRVGRRGSRILVFGSLHLDFFFWEVFCLFCLYAWVCLAHTKIILTNMLIGSSYDDDMGMGYVSGC